MMAVDVGQWPMTKTNGLLSLSPSSTMTNIYRRPMMAVEGGASGLESKIVPFLKEGAGVVSTRAHVHYIVTEYGVANLYGKNLRQRASELIRIAHPDHRDTLEKAAFDRFHRA